MLVGWGQNEAFYILIELPDCGPFIERICIILECNKGIIIDNLKNLSLISKHEDGATYEQLMAIHSQTLETVKIVG